MFAVYCPAHRSRILMFADNIEALVNGPGGVEIHWRCGCGEVGVERANRAAKIVGGAPWLPLQMRSA